MLRSKKVFTGGINQDDSLHLIEDAQYLRIMNGRVGVTEYGKNFRVENVPGTTAISQAVYPPYGTNMTIGSCIDIEGQRMIWFVWNSVGDHGIYCYDFAQNQVYAVLYDSQVAGGLNFSKDYRIDKNARVNQGLLYWTDNYNEPKKINIDSGIKLNYPAYSTTAVAYTSFIDSYEINLIRRPPVYAPSIEKLYDNSYVNNFIAVNSWQFAWQYVYFDGEESVLGEFSIASNMNLLELGVSENYNYINCELSLNETIPQTARIIRLIAKNQITNAYNVIKTYDKVIDPTPFINHNLATPAYYTLQGNWNANTNTPNITGTTTPGYAWLVTQDGSTNLGGITDWQVGDLAIKTITGWINSRLNQLSFDYYGDVIGQFIDSATAVKPFDSVPLLTKTLETATNRLFLGNNLSGYNTPTSSSLSFTQTPGTVYSNPLIITRQDNQTGFPPSITGNYKLILSGSPQIGDIITLFILVSDTTETPTTKNTTINYTVTSTDLATTRTGLLNAITADSTTSDYNITVTSQASPIGIIFTTNTGNSRVVYINDTITYINPATTDRKFFKNESSYQLGICFYDKARRKCGIFTNGGLIFETPLKTYINNTATLTVDWTLSNSNALNEIPDWAYYYSIDRTLNLKTRYFIDTLTTDDFYANKDSQGVYEYTKKTFDSTVVAIALDNTILLQSKLGYTYNEGDVCVLINSSTGIRYELPIIGIDGNYILLKPLDIGDLTTALFSVEIYTPYVKSDLEPFYEVGNIYPITNAGGVSRTYSTLSGSLEGDVFIFQRIYNSQTYYVEAMSPNDDYYQYWLTDVGFSNLVTLLGQKRNQHEIRYSNVYTPGTTNNGSSTFEALNFKTVPLGTGLIQKLQLASKTTEQGVIMLAICSLQTASCYLGEVQVVGSSQNAFLAQDASVIGTINVLKGMLGTTSPETVVEYLGVIFWYDLNNGTIAQYSSNGLFPISSFKMERLFKNYAKGYLATSNATLDSLNGFHHIPSFIDPFHKEFGISLPGLIADGSAAVLPSYASVPSYATSIINRFDISDNLAKSLTFNIQENKWVSDYQFLGEQYEYFENRMFGFKNGALYEFNKNSSTWNTWFGTAYPVRICWVLNQPLSGLKDMSEITLEGIQAPNYTVVYTTLPNTQITDLTNTDYVNQEGIYYGKLFRDRLSPNASGTADEKMMTGDVVLSQIPQIMTEFQCYSSIFYVNFVDVGFNLSRGQNFILNNK